MSVVFCSIKERIDTIIGKRIEKLKKDLGQIPKTIDNKRRRHPAHKQITGRIKELKYIRNKIRGMLIK